MTETHRKSDWKSDVKSTNYLRSAANNLCLCPCSEHVLSQDHWNKPLGLEICIKKKKIKKRKGNTISLPGFSVTQIANTTSTKKKREKGRGGQGSPGERSGRRKEGGKRMEAKKKRGGTTGTSGRRDTEEGNWGHSKIHTGYKFVAPVAVGIAQLKGEKIGIAFDIPFLHNSIYLWSHVQLPCLKSRLIPSYLSWHLPEPICQQDRKLVPWICPIFVQGSREYLIIQESMTLEGN